MWSVPCEAGVVCERAWGGMRLEFNCGWIDSSAGRERQMLAINIDSFVLASLDGSKIMLPS